MRKKRKDKLLLICITAVLSGCASSDGKQVYVDGKCISCWNNPITGKAINYKKDESISQSSNASKVLSADQSKLDIFLLRDKSIDKFGEKNTPVLDGNNIIYFYQAYANKPYSINDAANLSIKNYRTARDEFDRSEVFERFKKDYKKNITHAKKIENVYFLSDISLGAYDFKSNRFPISQKDINKDCFVEGCFNSKYRYETIFSNSEFLMGNVFSTVWLTKNKKFYLHMKPDKAKKLINDYPGRLFRAIVNSKIKSAKFGTKRILAGSSTLGLSTRINITYHSLYLNVNKILLVSSDGNELIGNLILE